MRIALIAATLLIPLSEAASLSGSVVDATGASIAKANVELDSGAQKYQTQTDDAGVYNFPDLATGEYTVKVSMPGFKSRTVKSIRLSERDPNRLLDIPLDVAAMACGQPIILDRTPLPSGTFGSLKGSVSPAVAGVEVTLVCRTFSPCRSTKTDSNGRFSFEMISAGVYGLNFHGEGYYPENATGYGYFVNAGWESLYGPVRLERCRNGNCDPKLRPKPVGHCE